MTTTEYNQGVATLGFPGGPSVAFRLNPDQVGWNFKINTAVIETLGGRVVQVLGATLSDITVAGSFGEVRGAQHTESRVLAEAFFAKMQEMAAWQSRDSRTPGVPMQPPAIFTFPAKGWEFEVYIRDLSDPDGGGSVTHRSGKYSYGYVLTLFVHADRSNTSKILGKSNGIVATTKDAAIQSYIDRIADGIGWKFTEYNGHAMAEQITVGTAAGVANDQNKHDPSRRGGKSGVIP